MQKRFEGKVAVVTGAAQGIGNAVARRLASEGASVVIVDRQADAAAQAAAKLVSDGAKAAAVPLDVTEDDCGTKLVHEAVAAFGGIHIGVFCAGVTGMKDWLDIAPKEWDRMLDINLRGTFLCAQAIAHRMIEQKIGGALVMFAATSGHGPRPDAAHYGVSKAGVMHLARSAALGLAKYGIRVNAISPGVVHTPMWSQVTEDRASLQGITPEQYEVNVLKKVPLGRAAAPEEIAGFAAFLLSDEASYITGQIILQDGGFSLIVA